MPLRRTLIRSLCTPSFILASTLVLAGPLPQPINVAEVDPWMLLKRVYAEPFPVDAVAIQKRSVSPRSSVTARIVVTRHRSLVSRTLEPIVFQGHSVWDDGRTLRRYDPDAKMLVKQPSPQQYRPSITQRMTWAKQNYTATVDGVVTVAGRDGYQISLVPTHEGMPQRRMVIDTEKPFILRSERMSSRKTWIMSVNTVEVRYDAPDDDEAPLPESTQQLTEWGPRPVSGFPSGSFESLLGAELPPSLPLGFHLVARHAVGSSWENACLAYRLSDGVASVTVYAWDTSRTPNGPYKDTPVMATSPRGLKYAAFGDVSPSVSARIAQVFAGGEGATGEPQTSSVPLTPLIGRQSRQKNPPPSTL